MNQLREISCESVRKTREMTGILYNKSQNYVRKIWQQIFDVLTLTQHVAEIESVLAQRCENLVTFLKMLEIACA